MSWLWKEKKTKNNGMKMASILFTMVTFQSKLNDVPISTHSYMGSQLPNILIILFRLSSQFFPAWNRCHFIFKMFDSMAFPIVMNLTRCFLLPVLHALFYRFLILVEPTIIFPWMLFMHANIFDSCCSFRWICSRSFVPFLFPLPYHHVCLA